MIKRIANFFRGLRSNLDADPVVTLVAPLVPHMPVFETREPGISGNSHQRRIARRATARASRIAAA
jgi:hypothetical protein